MSYFSVFEHMADGNIAQGLAVMAGRNLDEEIKNNPKENEENKEANEEAPTEIVEMNIEEFQDEINEEIHSFIWYLQRIYQIILTENKKEQIYIFFFFKSADFFFI